MNLKVLNSRGRFQRILPDADAKKLIWNEFCDESQEILRGLKRQKARLRCDCKVTMHTVLNPETRTLFLRRNPSQTRQHERSCGFWSPEGAKNNHTARNWNITKITANKYLLNTRIRSQDSCLFPSARKIMSNTPAATEKQLKYRPAFSFLYSILETLGVSRYPNRTLGRNITWEDVYRFLQGTIYKDLFWCPSTSCSGGSVGLNQKILKNWKDPERVGQGLLLGIVDEIPNGKFEIRKFYKDKYPIKCQVEQNQQSFIGPSGPYFMLAVCTANTKDHPQYAMPVINRMVLQAIKSWSSWIPVETDAHRKIISMLFQTKNPFEKPFFPKGLNLDIKPDFVIDGRCVVDLSGSHAPQQLESYFKLPVVTGEINEDASGAVQKLSEMIGYSRPAR